MLPPGLMLTACSFMEAPVCSSSPDFLLVNTPAVIMASLEICLVPYFYLLGSSLHLLTGSLTCCWISSHWAIGKVTKQQIALFFSSTRDVSVQIQLNVFSFSPSFLFFWGVGWGGKTGSLYHIGLAVLEFIM